MPDSTGRNDPSPTRRPSRLRRLLSWKRVAASLLLVLLVGPLLWRQWLLWRVPDLGDPVPIAEVLEPIPAETNAYPLFEEAYALLQPIDEADEESCYQQESDGWDPQDDLLNKYLELNRPALDKWREATERADYQVVPVLELTNGVYLPAFGPSRDLARWAKLETERLIESDRPAEALPWLKASLRASALMTRNASWLQRLVAAALFAYSVDSAARWAEHPDLTADELLRLRSIVLESRKLVDPPSATVKVEHLALRREYEVWSYTAMKEAYDEAYDRVGHSDLFLERPFQSRLSVWLRAEPEFSRRLVAHMTANHLPHIDAPRRERPPLLADDLFDVPPDPDMPSEALPAGRLIGLLSTSRLLDGADRSLLAGYVDMIDRYEARSACLQVAIAAQAYYRRHGDFPVQAADLQPEYLPELPDDPFSPHPAPVIYRRTGDGAVVYSRYTNEADDGGVTRAEAPGGDPPDFGLRIRIPGSSE